MCNIFIKFPAKSPKSWYIWSCIPVKKCHQKPHRCFTKVIPLAFHHRRQRYGFPSNLVLARLISISSWLLLHKYEVHISFKSLAGTSFSALAMTFWLPDITVSWQQARAVINFQIVVGWRIQAYFTQITKQGGLCWILTMIYQRQA